ncbi:collagen-binding protein [Siphonobacter sp. SORGH_AS_0500]|uniref:TonB-dependent receptor n=1 Tax=Siphonobacter sp. SORGH_AS_0500 TaxID=1864824 RepID=UPI000CB0E77D|nr:TonB-dependent receptor [Siphonobacter sp. SORGH_AS_0500]PKK37649.1 collagen-binding protein [Siphonobacter sp. SORGH_AS_0500]
MKQLLPLWLLGCFFVQTALGQSIEKATISGYVKDAANGEGLIGVSVFVKEKATGAATNSYGFYSITLPKGNYTLVYSFVGYQRQEKQVDLTQKDVTLNLEMKDEGIQLQDVVVRSQAADENVKSVEMSVNKVDIKTIKQMPALLGEVDLVRSIQLLPGVSTVGEGASGFNVRGGDVGQNLILLDEAPVYNSSHLFGFFSVFNPDAVKDVKLVKGGIPANYGGRISSILDVRMKEGNSKKQQIEGGLGLIFSRLTYERPIFNGKGSFIVAGRRSYADILAKPFLKGDLKGAVFNFYDLTAKGNYQLNDNNTFYVSGYFGRDNFGGGDFGFNWGNGTVSTRWNHIFSNRLFLNVTGYYSNYKYSLGADTSPRDSFKWNSQIKSASGKADFTYFLTPSNQLTFGGQYIYYDSAPGKAIARSVGETVDISLEGRRGDESALYVANEQRIGKLLTLQYGLRYSMFRSLAPGDLITYLPTTPGDHLEPQLPGTRVESGVLKTYGNWEPRFSAKVQVNSNASIKMSYNRMAQYLHLLSNTAASSPLDVWTLSSSNIKPELADQVALGWFQNFKNNAYEFSIEGYYKDLQNQIDYVRRSDLLLNRFVEGDLLYGKGRAYGAEFYLKKNEGKLTGWVSYTLARTERLVDGINNNNWFAARFDKTHNLTAVGIYQVNDRLSFSANFAASSGTPATYPTSRSEWSGGEPGQEIIIGDNYYDSRNGSRIPWYHRLDLSVTRKAKKKLFGKGDAEWVYSIYNVYNRRNPFSVFVRQNENDPLRTEAVRYAVLGSLIPSITYNFKF